MCQYFKEEEQQEKGHRGMKGSDLSVGLLVLLSGRGTVLHREGWWKTGPERSGGGGAR